MSEAMRGGILGRSLVSATGAVYIYALRVCRAVAEFAGILAERLVPELGWVPLRSGRRRYPGCGGLSYEDARGNVTDER
jgi:hypothetical protein